MFSKGLDVTLRLHACRVSQDEEKCRGQHAAGERRDRVPFLVTVTAVGWARVSQRERAEGFPAALPDAANEKQKFWNLVSVSS